MSRRFAWFAVLIVVAIAAYTAAWFWAAGQLVDRAGTMLADLNRSGNRAVCENPEARGYPFRIGLFCTATFFEDRASGVSVSSHDLRSAAQIYDPYRLVAELDGPGRVTLPGLHPIDLAWETLRASVRLASPLPERISVEARNVSAQADLLSEAGRPVFTADSAELHIRPDGIDLDAAFRFRGLKPGALPWHMNGLPALDGLADLSVREGVILVREGRLGPRGVDFDIRNADLVAGTGAGLSISGPLSIDEAGLIDAQLTLNAQNSAALADILTALFPDFAAQIEAALPGLSALGEKPSLPLGIVKGEVRLAFLRLGSIPPL